MNIAPPHISDMKAVLICCGKSYTFNPSHTLEWEKIYNFFNVSDKNDKLLIDILHVDTQTINLMIRCHTVENAGILILHPNFMETVTPDSSYKPFLSQKYALCPDGIHKY